MIISAVADPEIFGPGVIVDELAKREAQAFLQGIVENGVLIVDTGRVLLTEALLNARQLPTRLGQKITLFLEELVKNHKKYLVKVEVPDIGAPHRSGELLLRLSVTWKADAVVTSRDRAATLRIHSSRPTATEVISVTDYTESICEVTRRRLLAPRLPLDCMDVKDREEYIGRSLKYSFSIRFFDGLLVSSEDRVSKYTEGLLYFISVWNRWCVVGEESAREIEIFTVGNKSTPNGFLRGREASERLDRIVISQLEKSFKGRIVRHVKQESAPGIFHARFLQAKRRAYMVDPGFDSFDQRGPIRRCFLSLEPSGERHLDECRNLSVAS